MGKSVCLGSQQDGVKENQISFVPRSHMSRGKACTRGAQEIHTTCSPLPCLQALAGLVATIQADPCPRPALLGPVLPVRGMGLSRQHTQHRVTRGSRCQAGCSESPRQQGQPVPAGWSPDCHTQAFQSGSWLGLQVEQAAALLTPPSQRSQCAARPVLAGRTEPCVLQWAQRGGWALPSGGDAHVGLLYNCGHP